MSCTHETGGGANGRVQRLTAAALRGSLSLLLKPAFLSGAPAGLQRRWLAALSRSTRPAAGVARRNDRFASVPAEVWGKPLDESRGVVLYLHGGGYIAGAPVTHRAVASHLARAADATVVVADYRLAPEDACPAALDDAEAVYQALIDAGVDPARLAVAGDSAGGGLTLALLQRLRDRHQPLPACALMYSPWVDLTLAETPSSVPGEAMLSRRWLAMAARAYVGDAAADPQASPLFGGMDGLPPLLIQTGSDEILKPDSDRLADALATSDTEARYQLYPNRWHVFQAHAGQLKDADRAIAESAAFLARHWRRR